MGASGVGLALFTVLCWPAVKNSRQRHQTSVDRVRQMMKQLRHWLPGRRLVLVVDGGCAAVSLALACVKYQVGMVSRLRWDAALYHQPGPQPPGKRGRKPSKGKRQRSLQAWAERSDPPWEDVAVDWYRGQRQHLWGFSHTALWSTPGLPPVEIRVVSVCDPEGKRRMEAFFCTDLQATPVQILEWVLMRWSVEVTVEEARAHLGFGTPRQWSDKAIAHTTPALLAVFSLVTVLALQLSQGGHIPVQATAWYRKAEPTFGDCLVLVRRHLWRAWYAVNSPEAEFVQFPREAFDLLINGLPLAA
jgi:DDE superfamily endonuclease